MRGLIVLAGLAGLGMTIQALVRLTPGPAPDSLAPPAGLKPIRAADSWRFGAGAPRETQVSARWLDALGAGWYLNWTAEPHADSAAEFWPMLRLTAAGPRPGLEEIGRLAAARPGAHWLVGNEPDVAAQDNLTPEAFAEGYQAVYQALKAADPACQVGPGGLAQVSPLRLEYLDRALTHYRQTYGEALPADFWGAHLYVLREERGSWGAGIPPGLEDASGWLVEIGDHGQAALVEEQVWRFRRWMQANGYAGRPLIVTEYGILMPASYGFPPEVVADFMRQTFDFFMQAADPELGDPQDEGRLVQRWAWFSLAYPEYPASDLVDVSTNELTSFGWAYRNFVAALP